MPNTRKWPLAFHTAQICSFRVKRAWGEKVLAPNMASDRKRAQRVWIWSLSIGWNYLLNIRKFSTGPGLWAFPNPTHCWRAKTRETLLCIEPFCFSDLPVWCNRSRSDGAGLFSQPKIEICQSHGVFLTSKPLSSACRNRVCWTIIGCLAPEISCYVDFFSWCQITIFRLRD